MLHRPLGKTGPVISALGLGCMGMSGMYGPSGRVESIATLHAALDAGVTLLDTGDFYGMGHNEMPIGEALRGRDRDRIVLSVKFGALRDSAGGWSGYDCCLCATRNFVAYLLTHLRVDDIDISRATRLKPCHNYPPYIVRCHFGFIERDQPVDRLGSTRGRNWIA